MIIFEVALFFITLIAILSLFGLKEWELRSGRVLAPRARVWADGEAIHLKELMQAGRKDMEKIPPLLLYLIEQSLRGFADGATHFAHWLGIQAHNLADSVSHKRNFQRRQTRSEFLRKVAEHKNGNGEIDVSRV
jgi:hypothetical protein